ncbi:hypothetical protein M885DRAFT_625767 [Pelagophyceae sp. CCMP2097]|nr:hypothetical protein M885DRAFT_625767 [Pelagophyceae sp. CCMP2097]
MLRQAAASMRRSAPGLQRSAPDLRRHMCGGGAAPGEPAPGAPAPGAPAPGTPAPGATPEQLGIDEALAKFSGVDRVAGALLPLENLESAWWRLEERRRRRPGLMGTLTSWTINMMQRLGEFGDGRFEEGCSSALAHVHDALQRGDAEALRDCCDAPLAQKLEAARAEAHARGVSVVHALEVLRPPQISHWRAAIGAERAAVLRGGHDGSAGFSAMKSGFGILIVLPNADFQPLEAALKGGSTLAAGTIIADAMDNTSVSFQCVVDFPAVREALVAWQPSAAPGEPDLLWPGSTKGWVLTKRQAIFEATFFREGDAIRPPEWKLVDLDDLMQGGAPYYSTVFQATNRSE